MLILVMYVDNSGIRHNCEEFGQEFEKFVVMAMKPGADLDSLPILVRTTSVHKAFKENTAWVLLIVEFNEVNMMALKTRL